MLLKATTCTHCEHPMRSTNFIRQDTSNCFEKSGISNRCSAHLRLVAIRSWLQMQDRSVFRHCYRVPRYTRSEQMLCIQRRVSGRKDVSRHESHVMTSPNVLVRRKVNRWHVELFDGETRSTKLKNDVCGVLQTRRGRGGVKRAVSPTAVHHIHDPLSTQLHAITAKKVIYFAELESRKDQS